MQNCILNDINDFVRPLEGWPGVWRVNTRFDDSLEVPLLCANHPKNSAKEWIDCNQKALSFGSLYVKLYNITV